MLLILPTSNAFVEFIKLSPFLPLSLLFNNILNSSLFISISLLISHLIILSSFLFSFIYCFIFSFPCIELLKLFSELSKSIKELKIILLSIFFDIFSLLEIILFL